MSSLKKSFKYNHIKLNANDNSFLNTKIEFKPEIFDYDTEKIPYHVMKVLCDMFHKWRMDYVSRAGVRNEKIKNPEARQKAAIKQFRRKQMISNVEIYGLNESIVASGYPMKTETGEMHSPTTDDWNRAKKLANTSIGSGHSTYLQGVVVQFDLTFTVKAWTEGERYHFFDFVSSQSTMHRITKFDLDNAYIEYVDKRIIEIMKEKVADYNDAQPHDKPQKYLEILYSNPCGFRLTARMTTNYQQLRTMYKQRKNHRLPEWQEFCKWIESLPYAKELITGVINNE